MFRMNTEDLLIAIFWTLLVSMFLLRFWFAFRVRRTGERIRAEPDALKREGLWARVVEYVFLLLLAALVGLLWFQGGSLGNFAFPAPDWLRWAGCGLGIASVGLFAWTHTVLGRFWSPYLQLRPGHRLIANGPYARIRHPMYSAIVAWMISLGLVAANWIPFVFATLSALNFILRIQGEEKMMLQQFGDEYREYMNRTGRLLPAPPRI
jgi:protein-S-isoprenylcysteine O-methyltransferase Ste14